MTTDHITARCQTFGDYGAAPDTCWRAWFDGGARWAEHVRRCRACAETEAHRKKRKRGAA